MTPILLLDLDDTLLEIGADRFVQAYLGKLGGYLNNITGIPSEEILQNLLRATRTMIQNDNPDRTLEQVFNGIFYPALGFDYDDLIPSVDDFYSQVYPTLQSMTSPVPGAREVVDFAMEQGWKVVIATNPVFPATATRQRIEWAGFPAQKYPFDLVTSFENMHFAKPNPAYYAEILSQLGSEDTSVLMAGNDWSEDVFPARQAGIAGYLVTPSNNPVLPPDDDTLPHGSMKEFSTWLQKNRYESLEPDFSGVPAILSQMAATPAALATLFGHLAQKNLKVRPAADEWSLTEIFCHLRDVECDVNLPRLAMLNREPDPFLAAQDTDLWAEQRDYLHQDGKQALSEFTHARMQALDRIRLLDAPGWDRITRHAIFGQTTVQELFGFVATHDRLHIQQAHRQIVYKRSTD